MENIKQFLACLGFSLKDGQSNIWEKSYTDYIIQVNLNGNDLNTSTIDWGDKIQFGSATTSNFSQEETLVVLECVDRLLTKGYKPEDLHLEKVYPSGHGTSGRLDILVEKEGRAFLMIECKTWGKEYEKELKNTHKDGGQLLKYLQQDTVAQYLVLYTSRFENDKIDYKNEIIVVEQSYRETGNVKDLFDRWNKFTKSTGIFDPWVKSYNFESKALTLSRLKPITQGDSSFIFNRFLEILRHNAVSDKPNAFNRIFTLFLCKVKDEDRQENEELDFQWKGGEDDHIKFQVRLSDLYKSAMKEFLEKEITDLSNDDFELKYGDLKQEIKDQLKDEFIKLRLQKNNEFAIKDVFDQETFEENAVVLKEVVELLQPFKFRYNKKQPFLGEFFELLLTTGLKQEVGQFFTPVPIARFICRSVPMQESVENKLQVGETNELLPNIIDYACGSGHFLTEAMEEIHNIIQKVDSSKLTPKTARILESWKIDQFGWAFDHIYGIERDYRLVKTTKVGCYLHGDGIARIIHGDGLDSFDSKSYQGKLRLNQHQSENPKFDFILSNPPYSVSSFKGNLKNKHVSNEAIPEDKKPFELYKNLTDQSSEIEVLFVERTKQLLKDGGIAAIILPSSILSNIGLYTKSRELFLKYFEFISIVELGNNTFMATGTNTVILFLRRRNNYQWKTVETHIQKAFETKQDLTIHGTEKLIGKYLKNTDQKLSIEEYFQKFQNDELEKEKLLYFALAYSQKIVLINSGQKDDEKKFLGYYFSNRRGHEGIKPFVAGQTVDECTYLYDENDLFNPKKASTYIQKAFAGELENTEIDSELQNNISKVDLVDLLDFESKKFEKIINTRAKKKLKIESKWEVVKLGEVCEIYKGVTFDKGNQTPEKSNVSILTSDNIELDGNFTLKKQIFLKDGTVLEDYKRLKKDDIFMCFSSGSKKHVGKLTYISEDTNYYAGGFMGILRAKQEILNSKYLYSVLNSPLYREAVRNTSTGSNINNLSKSIQEVKLPLPPLEVQAQIVSEIEKLETEGEKAKNQIEELKNEVSQIVENAGGEEVRLGDVAENLDNTRIPLTKSSRKKGAYPYYGASGIVDYVDNYIFDDYLLLISEDGANLKSRQTPIAFTAKGKFWVNNHVHVLKFTNKSTHKLVEMFLDKADLSSYITGTAQPKLNQENLNNIKIPLPPLETQQKIVSQIQEIEQKIESFQKIVDSIPAQKESILKKYL